MNIAKNHTPRCWRYGVRPDGTMWLSLGDPVKGPHRQGDLHASEEDAQLIIAAPYLLEAAKEVYAWMNDLPIPTDGCTTKMQVLYDAIAKAEGRA